jgi:hypothetical protein
VLPCRKRSNRGVTLVTAFVTVQTLSLTGLLRLLRLLRFPARALLTKREGGKTPEKPLYLSIYLKKRNNVTEGTKPLYWRAICVLR